MELFKSVCVTVKCIQPQKNAALEISIFSNGEQITHIKNSVVIQSNKCVQLLLVLRLMKLKTGAFHHAV